MYQDRAREPAPLLIDSRQAAALLGVSPRTLWTLTKNGTVPSRRIRNMVRYSPAELKDWIARGCPSHGQNQHSSPSGTDASGARGQ